MVTGILLMLLAAYWFYVANGMTKVEFGIGPGGYPMFVSAGLFVVGLILTLQSVIQGLPKPKGKIDRKTALRVVIFVVITFLYVRLLRPLGFVLLTPPYLFFACCFFKYRRKIVAGIASIVVTAILYIVFRMIFYVPLPVFRLF